MRYKLADDFNMATLSTAGAAPVARFQLLNEEDLAALLDQADSKNTKRQIKYAVSIFEEYCSTSGDEIEKLTDAELDDLLSRFYGGARNKSGELYSKKTMQAIRYGLQRHFESTRKIDIVKGNDFKGSNKVLSTPGLLSSPRLRLGDDSRPGVESTSGVIISTIILLSSQYLYTANSLFLPILVHFTRYHVYYLTAIYLRRKPSSIPFNESLLIRKRPFYFYFYLFIFFLGMALFYHFYLLFLHLLPQDINTSK